MGAILGFQEPVAGLFVKLVVDTFRAVFPAVRRRWVHLVVLLLSGAVAAGVRHGSVEEFLASWITISLAAIGANEATRRRRSEHEQENGSGGEGHG